MTNLYKRNYTLEKEISTVKQNHLKYVRNKLSAFARNSTRITVRMDARMVTLVDGHCYVRVSMPVNLRDKMLEHGCSEGDSHYSATWYIDKKGVWQKKFRNNKSRLSPRDKGFLEACSILAKTDRLQAKLLIVQSNISMATMASRAKQDIKDMVKELQAAKQGLV